MTNRIPVLETQRLILRRIAEQDLADLFRMRSDPRMIEFTDSRLDTDPKETGKYLAVMDQGIDDGKWLLWAITSKETGKVIGSVSIWNLDPARGSGELGYGIVPESQHQGFMKEALAAVCAFAFDRMDLIVLEAYTEEGNINSGKLLLSSGFSETGRVDDDGVYSDRIFHMVIYQLKRRN